MSKKNLNQALYRAYRPGRFADVVGQDPVIGTLRRAVELDRVAHAYLFTGPRGTGKTSSARILAKAIDCAKPKQGDADNACESCQAISAGTHLDVIEIDAASNRGIDEIRELRDKVSYAPSQAERKIYIIDEVHMLTKEAFNALLKTLEEPPEHVTFVLATTEPQKVPQTIISRCQRFDFKPATPRLIAGHLMTVAKSEGIALDEEAAELVARQARGSFRDALSMLDLLRSVETDQITAEAVREVLGLAHVSAVAALERAIVAADAPQALEVIREASEQGISAELFRTAVVDYLRSLLLAKVEANGAGKTNRRAAELAADWEMTALSTAIRRFLAAADQSMTALPELSLELAALEVIEARGEKPAPVAAKAAPASPQASAPTPQPPAAAKETLTEPVAPQAPSAMAKPQTPPAEVPKNAAELWEKLLAATKSQYSLSVCLQKTRPEGLSETEFKLAVQSEFFLEKLSNGPTKSAVEAKLQELTGKKLKLDLSVAEVSQDEAFDTALAVFEGAEVEETPHTQEAKP